MTPEELEQGKEWARRWREAGPLLEQIVREELASMPEDRRVKAIDSLAQLAQLSRQPRLTSGLVEQQRKYHQGRW